MPRSTDPEELFETEPKMLTVSELTRKVRALLEGEIGEVWVTGEVSNYRRQSSGHQYFTLKDDKCQVACVLFYRASLRQISLSDGMQVQVRGEVTVYEARGQYQLNVKLVQPAGAGLLQAKFEALKRRLEAEGLFDPLRKKPLPQYPMSVGIVTSPTGAAIRDMLNILHRRAPWVRIVINPARVQGDGAAEEIANAVREFNDFSRLGIPAVDVVVVCRGGGSAEDLWAFNEEVVARAIFDSKLPVVSAVGHEIDFTISDFVADLRAPTPSAAAELIVPDSAQLLRRLGQIAERMRREAGDVFARGRERLSFILRGVLLREPGQRVTEAQQRLDLADEALRRESATQLSERRQKVDAALAAIRQHRPDHVLSIYRTRIRALQSQLQERQKQRVDFYLNRLASAEAMMRVLAPKATLERGYSITTDEGGAIIRSVSDVEPGMRLRTKFKDGVIGSRAE
jgi:exodeoxyribonuclease VII large subunit